MHKNIKRNLENIYESLKGFFKREKRLKRKKGFRTVRSILRLKLGEKENLSLFHGNEIINTRGTVLFFFLSCKKKEISSFLLLTKQSNRCIQSFIQKENKKWRIFTISFFLSVQISTNNSNTFQNID